MRRAHVTMVVLLGCGTAPDDDGPALETAGPPRPVAVASIEEHGVAVLVAHERVATLDRAQLSDGIRLDELLETHPYTRWAAITVRGPRVAPTTWLEPVTSMPGQVPFVYLDAGRPALALVDAAHADPRAADLRAVDIDEISVELAKLPRTPEQALAAGCQPEPDDGNPAPPVPRHWRGRSYQFVTDVRWHNDLWLDLAPGPANDHVGSGTMYTPDLDDTCSYDFYRRPDRDGRRVLHGVLRRGAVCIDGIVELACDRDRLRMWVSHTWGEHVENGTLTAQP